MKTWFLLFLLSLSLSVPTLAWTHSGGTDRNGCHTNRRTGEYHCHGGKKAVYTPPAPSPTHWTGKLGSRDKTKKIQEYFRLANDNVGALSCNLTMHKRNVSKSLKVRILSRDGHRCVICGSTVKLEVDHKRALMNGGDNSESNLATLCDVCHLEKTRLDTALRRKRKSICKK